MSCAVWLPPVRRLGFAKNALADVPSAAKHTDIDFSVKQ